MTRNLSENNYKSYSTDDYSKDSESNTLEIDHQCKMGFVSVIKDASLNNDIGQEILELLEI